MKSKFTEKLTTNGWSNVHDPESLHLTTEDGNVIQNADAYLMNQIQPNFQAGLALFENESMIRLRVFNMPGDFNWLQIVYNSNLEALLDEIIAMQHELPNKSYFSLMSGTFKTDCQVSLLAWEQF
ncbi:MAG: hypothetical protein AAF502_09400 [Bacteroidota bacterium]